MTVEDAYEKLEKLIEDGHGDKKIGFFSHTNGDFIECHGVRVTKNGGYYEDPNKPKKTEKVVQIFPLGGF